MCACLLARALHQCIAGVTVDPHRWVLTMGALAATGLVSGNGCAPQWRDAHLCVELLGLRRRVLLDPGQPRLQERR